MSLTACIVGGGPAGVMLAYLLARNGIGVTLLEAQADFDRNFRGDTLHYSVMENLAQMGLADRLLAEKPHHKLAQMAVGEGEERVPVVDFGRIRTNYPYVTLMAQSDFLNFITTEAAQSPNFSLHMRTVAKGLLSDSNNRICGVVARQAGKEVTFEADLVVACDGRNSKLRSLAGIPVQPLSAPLDVLWFRLPRYERDASMQLSGGFAGGRTPIVIIERQDHFQIGIVVTHGSYRAIKAQGIEAFQQRLVEGVPQLADHVHLLDGWRDIAYLQVTGGRVDQWHQDGMLLIGDSAHVMTPLGGIGINYALQDAIVAANVLVQPLKRGTLSDKHFAEIQRQRRRPTLLVQTLQALVQRRILDPSSNDDQQFRVPRIAKWIPRIPLLRDVPARVVGGGFGTVRVQVC